MDVKYFDKKLASSIEAAKIPEEKLQILNLIKCSAYGIVLVPFGIGFLVGLSQRKKRRKIWEAEAANIQFLKKHGLVEVGDEIEDTNIGQRFRIENFEDDGILLFPIGRRGKRAFISIDRYGKFTEYTGMVHV